MWNREALSDSSSCVVTSSSPSSESIEGIGNASDFSEVRQCARRRSFENSFFTTFGCTRDDVDEVSGEWRAFAEAALARDLVAEFTADASVEVEAPAAVLKTESGRR